MRLKVTTYRFFSPNGTTNDKIGVIPDLLVTDESCAVLATLLSGKVPSAAMNHLRLTISGVSWYIDLSEAGKEENRAAFTELLEAIPPAALLERGRGGDSWESTTPDAVAQELGLTVSLRTFSDIDGSRYEDAINTMACYGMMLGDGDGTFRPTDTLTRGELACLITALLRTSPKGSGYFSDVQQGDWYTDGVNAIYELGFMVGDGDGTFRPDAPVTREELTVIVAQLGAWLNMDLYAYAKDRTRDEDFSALNSFSDWARPAADLCNAFGLLWDEPENIDGDTSALREETAAILYYLLAYADVLPD